jgi:transposase
MRVAPQIVLTQDQKQILQQWARGRSLPARQVERARIVLMAATGKQDLEIAAEIGISNQKAARWRRRFLKFGLAGLEKDAPGRGRRPIITPVQVQQVISKTTQEKPANATHWSTRTMAEAAGLSEKSVRRIWHKHGLKPHLSRTFKVSNDPDFAEKLEAIVGLYLNPPEHAIVLCADEKSQIQALDRTQPGLPIKKGRCGTMTHDYKPPWNRDPVCRAERVRRHRHQHVRRSASASRMVTLPEGDRPSYTGGSGNPPDRRQLCDAQTSQGAEVAGSQRQAPHILHTDQ